MEWCTKPKRNEINQIIHLLRNYGTPFLSAGKAFYIILAKNRVG